MSGLKDFEVEINYINRKTNEPVNKRTGFEEYTRTTGRDLMYQISDIEAQFTEMNHGAPIDEWSDDSIEKFLRLRREILNFGNSIVRLPEVLLYKGVPVAKLGDS